MDADTLYAQISASYLTSKTLARVKDICWKKCIPTVHNADMGFGEISCVDRCVNKWHAAEVLVTQIAMDFKKLNEETEKKSMEISEKVNTSLGIAPQK